MKIKELASAARELVTGIFHPAVRQHLGDGMLALSFILFRLVLLALFPITVPLLAWARRAHPYNPKGAGE